MKHIGNLLLVLFSFILFACEKDSNLGTPEFKPRLVVHSFISPQDTLLYVHVSSNKNLYGKLVDYPQDLSADVSLFDGDKEVKFEKSSNNLYVATYQIYPGKKYTLTVKCSGYPNTSSSTTVPQERNLDIQTDTISQIIEDEWGAYKSSKFLIKFNDIPNEKNFYNINAQVMFNGDFGRSIYSLVPVEVEHSSIYAKIVSDNLQDGKEVLTSFELYNYNDDSLHEKVLIGYVMQTDEPYYKYHTSLRKYSGTDEPLTEYSPVYSNITGGYGIFASYVKYVKVLKLN